MKWIMAKPRDQLADPLVESGLFRNRSIFVALVGLILMIVLIARLFHLQNTNYEHYSTQSTNNRVHLNAIAPARGLIFDRNGFVLAHNLPSFQLEITSEDVINLEETLQELSNTLSFSEYDLKRFRKALKRTPPFQGVALRFNLSEKEVAEFSVVKHEFPGVDIVARLRRHYPNGALAGHAIGYVGRINEQELEEIDLVNYRATREIGKIGIERQFESHLHGRVGHQQVEVNVAGRVLRVLEETQPQPGASIYLTLDAELQKIAEQALGNENGAIVAIDPNNGEVLAMVSKPNFDINLFVGGISNNKYATLRDDWQRPLFNRALAGTYPPGSTIKPLLGLAALEAQSTTTFSKIYCPGFYKLPKDEHKYRDWKHGGHGFVDLDKAITQSCDVMFYDLANKLGIDQMQAYLAEFGFGAVTGIDIRPESTGILPSQEWKQQHFGQIWYPGETLIAGIGQGYFTATPLQIAHAMAILAKPKSIYKPHLIYAIQSELSDIPQPYTLERPGKIEINDVRNWKYVIKSMVKVTSARWGTARKAFKDSTYSTAGKTGTAQVFSVAQDEKYDKSLIEKQLQDHALFAAFAPVEDPKIAIAVIVENGGSGSSVAAPIARKVIDAWVLDASKQRDSVAILKTDK